MQIMGCIGEEIILLKEPAPGMSEEVWHEWADATCCLLVHCCLFGILSCPNLLILQKCFKGYMNAGDLLP